MKYRLIEVETSEYSFNPVHDFGLDTPFVTAGQTLINDLGLEKFRHVYIQKVMGLAQNIYIITYNSKYPTIDLSATRVKKLKFTWLGRAKRKGVHTYIAPAKLTPPIYLKSSLITMTSGSLVVMRDISGEYLRNPRMFTYTDFILDKKMNGGR